MKSNAVYLGIKLMQELIDRTQDEMDLQYLAGVSPIIERW